MSDLALQRIAENKRSRAPFLYLGDCALSEVPAEVGELVWLESLSLASRWSKWDGREWQWTGGVTKDRLLDITPLGRLTALRSVAFEQVADLTPLTYLAKLEDLYIGDPTDCDLTPLANLAGLQKLCIQKIPNLRPLTNLKSLETLRISGAQVSDLTPLAVLSALQTLDVSNTQVSNLTPLAALFALQTLNARDTKVANLAPLAGLSALKEIIVMKTQVSDLAPLAGLSALQTLFAWATQVTDLAPLAGLSALQTLSIAGTQVTDLAPLAGLSALQNLYAWETKVTNLAPLAGLSALEDISIIRTQVSDLAPLAGLSALQNLLISQTQVSDLAPLAGLSTLHSLHAAKTKVANLAPLAGLSALRFLDISETQVSDLSPLIDIIRRGCPVKWSSEAGKHHGIYLEDCPLENPPPEIVKQGNEAILNYFRERAQGEVDHLYEAKMLILGEGGAGKTSLLRRLYQLDQPLPTEKETTRGISIYRHEFKLKNGRLFRLNVWDFGGQEIYHATHQFFLTHRSLYLLVDDTRKDHKSVSDEGFKYWLELIEVFGGHSPTLIFQNEKGSRSKPIDIAGIKGRYDNVKEKYAGNLERDDAVEDVRDGIEFYASHLSHIGEELPVRWIQVRTDIETRAGEVPYIPVQEYFDIYRRHMDFDRSRALHLSRYLHDLGVFLHFQDDPLLARTVILQNQWATEAVFRILDDEAVKANFGRFSSDDCERLWKDSVYADMHPELLALIQRFELCYELRDSKPPTWLTPQLLPPAKPTGLANWGKAEDMVLRYRYEFLPKGVISRLTVRLHRFLRDPEMAWVTGVLLERDDTAVLIEVLANGSEIELRARGPESKVLLSVIAADLDSLNESFQGLRDKVDKRIPCNCEVCRAASVPEFFEQKELLRRKEHNRLKVECRRSFREVDVLELLDGIKIDKLPVWANEA